jgi:polyisoprenyl-teichoic acid--peptidoglycan teichoic acid transferase
MAAPASGARGARPAITASAQTVTTPDLEATQRMPTAPFEEPPPTRHGPSLSGLGRLLILLVLLVGGVLAAALLLTPPRETILILGSDARPEEIRRGQVGRTDTLLLFVADRATPRVAMVSVPRDLWVSVPGHGDERVNAAYELGGSQTAKQTVSNVLGQRVDRFAVIGLQGVRDVVDAVGGVDVTVAQPIHDDAYPTDDYGVITVDIPAGRQHMDGETALQYARTRHQDSDFGRIGRQQQVLGAVRTALLSPVTWPRIPAVLLAAQQSIKTDLNPLDAIAIAAAILRDPGEPDRLVIDTSLVNPITGEGGAFLLEPKPELRSAVARFLGGGPSTASVEVLNGAGVAGLARSTADKLTRRGFAVANVADADRAQSQTTIEVRPEARRTADEVATALGVPTSRVSEVRSLPGADIRVTLGADAR